MWRLASRPAASSSLKLERLSFRSVQLAVLSLAFTLDQDGRLNMSSYIAAYDISQQFSHQSSESSEAAWDPNSKECVSD